MQVLIGQVLCFRPTPSPNLVTGTCPALRRFHSTEKAGRAWYLFSHEHDIIGKWQEFSEQTGYVSHILNLLYIQRLVCMTFTPRTLVLF